MAYLGGSLQIPKSLFYSILFVSLLIVVIRIFFFEQTTMRWKIEGWKRISVSIIAGSVLGFISGVVGIGGGIYLVPLIIVLGLGSEKQAAASGSIFIWLNSITGLIARIQNHSIDLLDYYPLIIAVFIGGMLGSWMGATLLRPQTMQRILGGIIVIALCLLVQKIT